MQISDRPEVKVNVGISGKNKTKKTEVHVSDIDAIYISNTSGRS